MLPIVDPVNTTASSTLNLLVPPVPAVIVIRFVPVVVLVQVAVCSA